MMPVGETCRIQRSLFTQAPRRGVPGNWASDVGHSRVQDISLAGALTLRLLRVLRGLDPGLPDLAVVLRPLPSTLLWVANLIDRALQIVELRLVKYQRVHELTCLWIVLGQVLADYRRYLCRVIQLAKSILWILQIPEVVALVHPVRRPRHQGELLPVAVAPLDLGENTLRARFNEFLLEAVGRNDPIVDYPH